MSEIALSRDYNTIYKYATRTILAPFACLPEYGEKKLCHGRLYIEPNDPSRDPFERDVHRLIHTKAYSRLSDKTQVFAGHRRNDHLRTRRSHTDEVVSVGRSLATALGLHERLVTANTLAHDFGHPPFGHGGETALDECMQPFGLRFYHNDNTIRIITEFASHDPAFPGLNLRVEVLEGLVKHNGPVNKPSDFILDLDAAYNFSLGKHTHLEGQIASLADDIAYNAHDIEDGLAAGIIRLDEILDNIGLIKQFYDSLVKHNKDLADPKYCNILYGRIKGALIAHMIEDVVRQTVTSIDDGDVNSVEDIRNYEKSLADFSSEMQEYLGNKSDENVSTIRGFLYKKMYSHKHVIDGIKEGQMVVRKLFERFMQDPSILPADWQERIHCTATDSKERADVVSQYISGLTDRLAWKHYKRVKKDDA